MLDQNFRVKVRNNFTRNTKTTHWNVDKNMLNFQLKLLTQISFSEGNLYFVQKF